ncbi:CHAT domain-containing protein [Suillus lakei]|nr:CHAT domain-containing protein [Suillus lakei]
MANRTIISGDAATRAGALEALEQNTWVHLACHGKQDHTQPYDSHFVMKDEPLTLLDIMDIDIPHAEFVFLSACHTAIGDKETPDEGFKSVVGTLWEVNDAVAKHVVEAFYESLFKDLKDGGVMDCTKTAWTLNRATHAVKTKCRSSRGWLSFILGIVQGEHAGKEYCRLKALFSSTVALLRSGSALNSQKSHRRLLLSHALSPSATEYAYS